MIDYLLQNPETYIPAAFAMSAITALTLATAIEQITNYLKKI